MNYKDMNSVSTKESPKSTYPKTILSILASVGGLAVFLLLASTLLVTHPIGATIRGYFYDSGSTRRMDSVSDAVSESNHIVNQFEHKGNSNLTISEGHGNEVISQDRKEISDSGQIESEITKESSVATFNSSLDNVVDSDLLNYVSGCDLYHGKWIYDSTGPLYTSNSCPVLSPRQNCQGNGRPDKDYENWRWKPSQCELPRFDAKKFLELMRGKTLAFVGDSIARNQMESMMCILWQVEVPIKRVGRKMRRFYFKSTSTLIVRIWSSWLVHQTPEPFDFVPAGVMKVHLDIPDERLMEYITGFDVIVLSSGHWFAKPSVYILNNEIVGGQLWWPGPDRKMKINNIEAFGVSVETSLTAIATHPNYTGLTIVRSFSPDHYSGGAWNTGGLCMAKGPVSDGELVENGFTNVMHEKQVAGFKHAMKKRTNKSKLMLMDITEAFSYRHDGHPGPYKSPNPNRGRDGRPLGQDCLHWCMPGPVDTWNEMLLEILRRENPS
ncbi:hypothetical protein BUALT_Bualt06G0124500 [Buddleja alternifolia]|uniref:Trichome birefringence-like N-terminal domain-containing protein n=1 Tax=Buddleja alternifolia TaxID=168488 RepID=A0AAV6XGE7_9LAMI|nr:hypothetical protein BUALT_Bualt06G0124500 [Buddleja alternifolia]